jgi:CRISPR/Cas system-associated protein endoribonuclease Cas2
MKKKLIIVGSGAMVLDYKSGQDIDSFDKIIRFNGYQRGLGTCDEYVGTKTDILFCNNTGKSLSHIVDFPDIYTNNTIFILKKVKNKKRKINNKQIKKVLLNNYLNNNIINYNKIIRSVEVNNKKISMPSCVKNPTLGLLAIFYAIEKYKDYHIYIHGFDRIVKQITGRRYMNHYYESGPNLNFKHAVRRETSVIRKLISNDFIKKFI